MENNITTYRRPRSDAEEVARLEEILKSLKIELRRRHKMSTGTSIKSVGIEYVRAIDRGECPCISVVYYADMYAMPSYLLLEEVEGMDAEDILDDVEV